ncbi:MAG: cyclic-di-AMP receptor [Caldilineaceae bacterium]
MILLAVIVQSEDASKLSDRLVEAGFRLTRLSATGGFLATGSAVLLLGVADDRLPAVTEIIEATCHTRTRLINAAPYPGMAGVYAMGTVAPVEVLVGGAVVFGVPVEHHLRLGGATSPLPIESESGDESIVAANAVPQPTTTERTSNVTPGTETSATGSAADPAAGANPQSEPASPFDLATPGTKLVVAVVQKENSDAVVNAVMDAGYRLTRIDTAGGFLRRGNATLLIGVEASRLNDVLALIHANCQPRSEPNPIQQGMPMYGATVFVVNASHFLRF